MEIVPANLVPDHELLREIGHGSYGEVWLARNLSTRAYRAIKVVWRRAFEHDKPYEREFAGLRKFEPVSRSHEGLMDVLHVGRHEAEGLFYAVMELADDRRTGQEIDPASYVPRTLRNEIQTGGRLPFEKCLELGISLASALGHLHQHGLVHRDIKPSNIIFVNGVPKLADIGLVTDRDATGSFVGTEGYVPPEGPGTPAADLYALGKVLYEICTGRDRLDYPELPTALKDFQDRAAVARLNEVILRACDPNGHERYRLAEELRTDLVRLKEGRPLPKRRSPRRPWAWAIAALALLTAAAALTALALLVPGKPALRLVRRVRVSATNGPSWPRLGDWYGDGGQELFHWRKDQILITTVDGKLLGEWHPVATNAVVQGLELVRSIEGGREVNALVPLYDRGTNMLTCLKRGPGGKPLVYLNFSVNGAERTVGSNLLGRTSLAGLKIVDLEQDGRRQLLAALHSGHGHLERGICCFPLGTNSVGWVHYTGPSINEILCVDLKGDKRQHVICGSAAPNNGNRASDGTDDSRSYIFAFSCDGKLLWTTQLGDKYSEAHPLLVKTNPQGDRGLFVWVSSSWTRALPAQEGKPQTGRIVRLDDAGNVTAEVQLSSYILNRVAADVDLDQREELIVTTLGGGIQVFSADLKGKRALSLGQKSDPDLLVEFLTIGDLNQDGRPEIVCRSYRSRPLSNLNAASPNKPPSVWTNWDSRLCVLDGALTLLATYELPRDGTSAAPPVYGAIGHFDSTGRIQLLVTPDDIFVFELRPRRFPRFW